MIRRLASLVRQFWQGTCRALAELWELVSVPFRGLKPDALRATVARGRQDLSASSHMIALETTQTVSSIVGTIMTSPIRAMRWLFHVPGQIWIFLRTRTWKQLIIVFLIAVVVVTGVVWPLTIWRHERHAAATRKRYDKQLQDDLARGDVAGVKFDLEALRKVVPNEKSIDARLKSLETGEAAADDATFARLLMGKHREKGNFGEACREAKKYLVYEPNDWMALTILAEAAWRNGKRQQAEDWIAKLPPARESKDRITLWTCGLATKLFRDLGKHERLEDLIDLIADNYLPFVTRREVAQAVPELQLQLIDLYTVCLRQIARRPELLNYWSHVQQLCQNIAGKEDASPGVLVLLGIHQETQLGTYLPEMSRLNLVSVVEANRMAGEIESRLNIIWNRVQKAEPKNPYSYIGLAMQLARAANSAAALAQIDAGLKACGPLPELIEKKAELLRRDDPKAALAYLDEVLRSVAWTPELCRMMVVCAIGCKQPELARQALSRAREVQPNATWTVVLEAEVLLLEGKSREATEVLKKVLPLIPRDATASGLYIRTLSEGGNITQAEEFLNNLIDNQIGSTAVVISGCEGLIRAGHVDLAVKVLKRLAQRDGTNLSVTVALSECLVLQSEKRRDGWDRDGIDAAIKGYRVAHRNMPNNLYFTNKITWLELTALDSLRAAQDTVGPLRAATGGIELTPEMLLTLGAISAYSGQFSEAKETLEKSLKESGPKPVTLAMLALTYQGLNQSDLAKETLEKALKLEPANGREAELIAKVQERMRRLSTSKPR